MILSLKDICLTIEESQILKLITFDIKKGSLVGIIGPNGSGKTSLFNCISGFLRPTSGSLVFAGEDITAFSPNQRALKGLGRVFQNFGIFREQSVLDNMLIALESRDSFFTSLVPSKKRYNLYKEQAVEFLKQVHLDSKLNAKAATLSGGQMRLLEIIRTLAFQAEVFLLDEPTAGVSPRMKDDIIEIIQKLKNLGKTVLIIEHDTNFIQSFVERIIVLNSGELFMDDTPDAVIGDARLQELYFGRRN